MTNTNTDQVGLSPFSRFALYGLVLPLLIIAGLQLFVLSEQTETYFAWTFAAPISAAFLGAGYWAAMLHAYTGAFARSWATVRTSLPAALTATSLLTVTTFMHLDKFHFDSPLFITRFVTWVWVIVYVTVPFILFVAWLIQTRLPGARQGTASAAGLDERRVHLAGGLCPSIWHQPVHWTHSHVCCLAVGGHTPGCACHQFVADGFWDGLCLSDLRE